MFVLYSFETGHPDLACSTAVLNAASLAPGTLAFSSRWLSVIEKPSPTFSNVTVHAVSRLSAVSPATPNWAESAMVKQPACAAASSSSGLVPLPSSNLVPKE